jgi:hypothetical protein
LLPTPPALVADVLARPDIPILHVQVSHHPPVSAFYFVNRKAGWSFRAVLRPKSKFLGNSAASIAEGNGVLKFTKTGEEYNITFPSYYVRGLLLGTMRMEIAGDVVVSCPQLKLEMTGTFKNRGYFSGENNSVEAKISSMEKKEVSRHVSLGVPPAACYEPLPRAAAPRVCVMAG